MPEHVAQGVVRGRAGAPLWGGPVPGGASYEWHVDVINEEAAGPGTPATVTVVSCELKLGDDAGSASSAAGGMRLRRTASLNLTLDDATGALDTMIEDLASDDAELAARWRIALWAEVPPPGTDPAPYGAANPANAGLYEYRLWASPAPRRWDPAPAIRRGPGNRVSLTATDRLALLDSIPHGLNLSDEPLLHRTLGDLLTLAAPLRTFVAVDVWPSEPKFGTFERPEEGVDDGVTGEPDIALSRPPSLILPATYGRVAWDVPDTAGGLLDALLRSLDLCVMQDPWVSGGALDDHPVGTAPLAGNPRWLVMPRRFHGVAITGRLVPYTGELALMAPAVMPARERDLQIWIDRGREAGSSLPARAAKVPLPYTFQPMVTDPPEYEAEPTIGWRNRWGSGEASFPRRVEVPHPGGITLDAAFLDGATGGWQNWRRVGTPPIVAGGGVELVSGDVLTQELIDLPSPDPGIAEDVRIRVIGAYETAGSAPRFRLTLTLGDTDYWLEETAADSGVGTWETSAAYVNDGTAALDHGDWTFVDVTSPVLPASSTPYRVTQSVEGPALGTAVLRWFQVALVDASGDAVSGIRSGGSPVHSAPEIEIGRTIPLLGAAVPSGSDYGPPRTWLAREAFDTNGDPLPEEEHIQLAWHAVYRAGTSRAAATVRAGVAGLVTLAERLTGLGANAPAATEADAWAPLAVTYDLLRGSSEVYASAIVDASVAEPVTSPVALYFSFIGADDEDTGIWAIPLDGSTAPVLMCGFQNITVETQVAAGEGFVYFTDDFDMASGAFGRVMRVPEGGGTAVQITPVDNGKAYRGVWYDPFGPYIYTTTNDNDVLRYDPDGDNETTMYSGRSNPAGIVQMQDYDPDGPEGGDPEQPYLFWALSGTGGVEEAEADGSDTPGFLVNDSTDYYYLAIGGGSVFYADQTGVIKRKVFHGAASEIISDPACHGLTFYGGRVYYITNDGHIRTCLPNGSDDTLVRDMSTELGTAVYGLAVSIQGEGPQPDDTTPPEISSFDLSIV